MFGCSYQLGRTSHSNHEEPDVEILLALRRKPVKSCKIDLRRCKFFLSISFL